METSPMQSSPKLSIQTNNGGIVLNKNFLIISLLALLIFSLLGINLLNIFGNVFQVIGNFFQAIINIFKPLIYRVLADAFIG